MSTFSDTIRAKLDAEQITVTELSRRSGVHRVHLHRILAGKAEPSLHVASAITRALGLRLEISENPVDTV